VTDTYVPLVGSEEIAPGTMRRFDIEGRSILVANVDGHFYATDDTCTHEDASLSAGALRGEHVTCPLHGSRFDLRTGEPLEEPAVEALRTYAVKVERGKVLVALT